MTLQVSMTLRVVGAGLGRTGTLSLKGALERLLGGRCYHMLEVFGIPEHVALWHGAYSGAPPDWHDLFADFTACVDWPGAGCWSEISAAYPDALVLLSTRRDADTWWTSADHTIFKAMRDGPPPDSDMGPWFEMAAAMLRTFTPDWSDEVAAKRAYEAHNAAVRAAVPAERLVEWQPGDGWGPLCAALGVPVPDDEFPHVNSTAEFRTNAGWD